MKHRPILKWAGNKYRLLDVISKQLPAGKRLVEPFAGTAALSMNADFEKFYLNDSNRDLIVLFKTLKRHGKDFIEHAKTYFIPKNNQSKKYYSLRERFNTSSDDHEKAALFLYLNRHGFNGLCRYNQGKGEYNVPFGSIQKPYFPEKELQHFHKRLQRCKLTATDFKTVFRNTKEGDVIYCDPPYVPLSETADFTQYSGTLFTEQAQQALASEAIRAAEKGIPVLISNHDTPFTRTLYQQSKMTDFLVPRTISRDGQNRKAVRELLALFD